MKNLIKLTLLIALGTALQAEAATIYTNGPANSTDPTTQILDVVVSNSFTVSAPTTLTSAVAALGAYDGLGDSVASVDWAIGTSFFASDISSGTASLTNTFLFDNGNQDIYSASFSLTGVLAPGTYYFSLTNGVTVFGTRAVWDQNAGVGGDGPSLAEVEFLGTGVPIPSHSFTLFGTTAAVPDSGSTLGLLLVPLAALFGATRFRSRRLA